MGATSPATAGFPAQQNWENLSSGWDLMEVQKSILTSGRQSKSKDALSMNIIEYTPFPQTTSYLFNTSHVEGGVCGIAQTTILLFLFISTPTLFSCVSCL